MAIPEHFSALIKQRANLISIEAAEFAIRDISEGLTLTLCEDASKIFFGYAPKYLAASRLPKQRFYTRRARQDQIYNHATLIARLIATQGLTSTIEVENRLRAYFASVRIVMDEQKFTASAKILPLELQRLI